MTTVNTKTPKGKKLLLFKVFAALFPFVLLVLLEFVLRFFHYGHNTDLFIKDPFDDHYMVMNKYASDKFFSDTANATKGNSELFQIDKAPNTFRRFFTPFRMTRVKVFAPHQKKSPNFRP